MTNRARNLLLLILPVLILLTGILFYFLVYKAKKVPTDREAIGRVSSIAGAGHPGGEDGPASEAGFSDPFGVAVDEDGNVYVADGDRIRRLTPRGVVETVAGAEEGFADGAANAARFNTPSGIAFDEDGNLFIADTSNHRIRKLDAEGQVTTVAGTGTAGFKDGAAAEAMFDAPVGVAVDKDGNVHVADTYNDCVRKISKTGDVTTVAGATSPGYLDGAAGEARFDTPCGLVVDEQGNLFVADTGNDAVRKITPQGEVITIAGGSKVQGDVFEGGNVRYQNPVALALTHDGFLFVTDDASISIITPEGEFTYYAGWTQGFADGDGSLARFSNPSGITVTADGESYVADRRNYLIRKIAPVPGKSRLDYFQVTIPNEEFIQPVFAADVLAKTSGEKLEARMPKLSVSVLNPPSPFPYPLNPQYSWHEVAGTVGEARGSFGGMALHHLHSGLDFAGQMGDPCLAVLDEKVSSPISTWGYNESGEGISVGLMSYIHIRVGRNGKDEIQVADKFKPRLDETGKLVGVRVRRGTRFRVGDFLGTLNRLYHVHMNVGPWNGQANALQFPFAGFRDTVAPVIEPNGVEIVDLNNRPFTANGKTPPVVTGDVKIIVTAYDQVDGNRASRKLGLYRVGYQILNEDGTPAAGFAEPLINIEFNRLPPGDEAVTVVYAEGSGVSAYGTPTKFRYIVTNRVRDGEAREGFLRTSSLAPGNYKLRVTAEDYAGNRASGKASELPFAIK